MTTSAQWTTNESFQTAASWNAIDNFTFGVLNKENGQLNQQ